MRRRATVLVLLAAVAFTACSSQPSSGIVIGSKNFTEQIVLAELLTQYIRSHTGLEVQQRANLGGTLICQQAIRAGKIDLYVEYTGTALTAVLGERPSADPTDVYHRVKRGYAQRFGLAVTEPLGFSNSFAMVIRGEDARRLNLRTISDIARVAPQWRAGFGYEFMERPDGFRGWADTYHLHFAEQPRIMELGLIYRALAEKKVDIVAGNSTDGVIPKLDFVALQDDRHYFPPYDAVPVAREDTLKKFPALRAALRGLGGKISEEEMRAMNYAVDGEHRDVKQVVAEFLKAKKM